MQDYLVPSPEQEFPSQSWKKKITIDLTLRHDQADQTAALTNIHNTSGMSHWLGKIQYLMHIAKMCMENVVPPHPVSVIPCSQ